MSFVIDVWYSEIAQCWMYEVVDATNRFYYGGGLSESDAFERALVEMTEIAG